MQPQPGTFITDFLHKLGGTRLTCHFKVITWNISFEFVQQARGNWMLIFFHRNLELTDSFAILYGVWSSGKGRTQACLQPLFSLLTISKVCLVMNEPFSASSVIVVYIETYSLYISSQSDGDFYQLITDGTCSRSGTGGCAKTRLRSTLIGETLELTARWSSYRSKRSFSAISAGMCVSLCV